VLTSAIQGAKLQTFFILLFIFLRKYFNEQQFLKIVSGNYYGLVFFACTVWFDKIKTLFKTKLNSMHFRML